MQVEKTMQEINTFSHFSKKATFWVQYSHLKRFRIILGMTKKKTFWNILLQLSHAAGM